MTITYTPDVANASFFCMFCKVMKIYRGSIYKMVWRDLVFFIAIFLTFQFVTLFALSESQQITFKEMRDSFYINKMNIPLHFILSFFVLWVVRRWRYLHLSIPSADTFSLLLNTAISDDSERSRLMKRTAVRYAIASFIINLRFFSLKMRKRFPTLQSIVNLGILLKQEEEILDKIEDQTLVTSYVIPLVWATNIINRARKEGLINNDCIVQDLLTELGNYRRKLGDLLSYDLVCIPLFYVQVATLAVYSYYFATIIGYQVCCDNDVSIIEIAMSLISASLQFTFHVGWVKSAEVLINPFGEDEDDFEVDLSVDRNLKSANMIVDYMGVNEPDYHIYEYPVFGYTRNVQEHIYETIDESNDHTENHLYCSIGDDVKTQTEDKYFEIYENIPVTSTSLQLKTPQSSSFADHIDNIYECIPPVEISSESHAREPEKTNIYEEMSIVTTTPHLSSDSDARQLEETYIYEEMSIVTTPPHLISDSHARKMDETNIYVDMSKVTTPPHLKHLSQSSSSYVDFVNVIHKNMSTSSSESDSDGKMEKTKLNETVPVAPAPSQQQTSSQSSSNVIYANVNYDNIPNDAIISTDSNTRSLLKSDVHKNVTPKQNKISKIFSSAKLKLIRKK